MAVMQRDALISSPVSVSSEMSRIISSVVFNCTTSDVVVGAFVFAVVVYIMVVELQSND